jgi:hypothetical protein
LVSFLLKLTLEVPVLTLASFKEFAWKSSLRWLVFFEMALFKLEVEEAELQVKLLERQVQVSFLPQLGLPPVPSSCVSSEF